MKGILRCNRDEVSQVRSVFPIINHFKGKRVVFHTLVFLEQLKLQDVNFINRIKKVYFNQYD